MPDWLHPPQIGSSVSQNIASPTAERRTDGNFGALNTVNVLLRTLHRKDNADNKCHQKRMSIEETHMPLHGARQVAFISVDLFQSRQQT